MRTLRLVLLILLDANLAALLRDGYGPRDDDGAAYGLARYADADEVPP